MSKLPIIVTVVLALFSTSCQKDMENPIEDENSLKEITLDYWIGQRKR
jgi:hypothetical protein